MSKEHRKIARYMIDNLGDEVMDEVVRLSILDSLDMGIDDEDGKLEKALKRVHNYYSVYEDRIEL